MSLPLKQVCHRTAGLSCLARRTTAVQQRSAALQPFSSTASTSQTIPPRTEDQDEAPPNFNLQEQSSLAHAELETHRELRALARTAAWEMPLLSALSKPFEPPTSATPLRWRYTTYLGEQHPAARKVVVEFSIHDLPELTAEQKTVLKKLAGPRWDPYSDIIKMSCESFETQAQNKRYLGETIARMIKESKEGEDKFEDVPLDTRHSQKRDERRKRRQLVSMFPRAWRLTRERKTELDRKRGGALLEEKVERNIPALPSAPAEGSEEEVVVATMRKAAEDAGENISHSAIQATEPLQKEGHVQNEQQPANAESVRIVDGLAAIAAAQKAEVVKVNKTEAPIMVEARRKSSAGKTGKREVSQKPGRR